MNPSPDTSELTERPAPNGPLPSARATSTSVRVLAFAAALGIATVAVYANSFDCPFIFDDIHAIAENPHVLRVWPLSESMTAPPQSSLSGRPIVSLSLAVNHALTGLSPRGFRSVNVIIHIAAALLLFGIVRRTLRAPRLAGRFGQSSDTIAFATALLWTLHPLQTQSVTYIIQRAESLMGMFYLATLYCLCRGVSTGRSPLPDQCRHPPPLTLPGHVGDQGEGSVPTRAERLELDVPALTARHDPRGGGDNPAVPNASSRCAVAWLITSVVACALGMASKEVMVTAPLIAIWYDGLFWAGSGMKALRLRPWYYAGLSATWLILAALTVSGPRSYSAGFGIEHLSPLTYGMTQPAVVLHYLVLAFWPASLCLDYGWRVARSLSDAMPGILGILGILCGIAWALLRRPAAGFLGAAFFIILAPTSSIVPINDLAFEHRMYLPLAAVCVLVVIAAHEAILAAARKFRLSPGAISATFFSVTLLFSSALGARTILRNRDYASPLAMWADVAARRPDNPRAYSNLGSYHAQQGDFAQAIAQLRKALLLYPDYAEALATLALTLVKMGRHEEALGHAEAAVKADETYSAAHDVRGIALSKLGRLAEAADCFRQAIRLNPDSADPQFNLACILDKQGRLDEAEEGYQRAIHLNPNLRMAHFNLAELLVRRGRFEEAASHYREVVRIRPDWARGHNSLGNALARLDKLEEAVASYQAALRLDPDLAMVHLNLANALFRLDRIDAAIVHYQEALRLQPDLPTTRDQLRVALQRRSSPASRSSQ